MHPDRTFRVAERAVLAAGLRERPFCTLAAAIDGRPVVAHAPVIVEGDGGRLTFHLSRANDMAGLEEGAAVVVTQLGPDAYISPDWYVDNTQVPTWNYRLIQAEGRVTRLSESELVDQLLALAAEQEAKLAPKPPWSMDKVPEKTFAGMLRGIVGFRLTVERLEGVDKLSQNKPAADREGVVKGLGNHPLGALIP